MSLQIMLRINIALASTVALFGGCYFSSPAYKIEQRQGSFYPQSLRDRLCLVKSIASNVRGTVCTNQFVIFNAERNVNYAFVIRHSACDRDSVCYRQDEGYVGTQFYLTKGRLFGERLLHRFFHVKDKESLFSMGFDQVVDMSDMYSVNKDFCGMGVKIDNWAWEVSTPRLDKRLMDDIPIILQGSCEKIFSAKDFASIGLKVLSATTGSMHGVREGPVNISQ